jgi:NDP-sugar pyrophosphorylase family protein
VSLQKAGIIAAGRGERLRRGGANLKPLVSISGRPLVTRVLASIAEAAPSEVAIIINDDSETVRDAVREHHWPFRIDWIVETTPSSMHSFLRVVDTLARDGSAGPFLLSTVDTIAAPGAYRSFAARAAAVDADIVLAVNEPGNDEKPLLVRLDQDGWVTSLGDPHSPASGIPAGVGRTTGSGPVAVLATAGFYMVRPSILEEAEAARSAGFPALRMFLAHVLARGFRLAAVPVGRSVDVDHPVDIDAAERFLKGVSA